MATKLSCVFVFCYLFQVLWAPQVAKDTGKRMMTEDEALSVLRSKAASTVNLGFVTVYKPEPTPSTTRAAQESLDEAQSKQLNLYGKGIFVNLMRAGGFVVLEFDTRSDMATRLHLVTLDETGETIVQSKNVEGDLSRSEALTIIERSEKLSDAFFNSPGSQLNELPRKFGGARVANVGIPDGQGYWAIPERVRKLTTQPDELLDLASLSAAAQLWPIRYASSMPIYAANPAIALKSAHQKYKEIVNEFLRRNNKSPDFVDHLLDLDSINTRDVLATRLHWLRDLVSFLDTECPCQLDSAIYRANLSISTIPLFLGVMKQNSEHLYAVMTASGLISIWNRSEGGELVLKGLSEGE